MRWRWLAIVVVVVVTHGVFWPVRGHDFVAWDDPHNFEQNTELHRPVGESLKFFWTKPYKDLWAPLTYTAWRGVAAVSKGSGGGLDPHAFHKLNLTLHVVAAAGLFGLIRRLVGNDWAACAGALVFAVHPIQVEAVAWASGTKDLMAGMFGILALLAHVEHLRRPRALLRFGAVGLLALALLSKPSAMVVVAMAAVIEWFFFKRRAREIAGSLWPWMVVTIPAMIVAKLAQPAGDVAVTVAWWARPVVALDSLGFYMLKVLVPVNFAIDYGRTPRWVLSSWQAGATGAAAVIAVVAGFAARRRWPAVAAGGAMFLAAVGPMLGLLSFDFQRISTVADRYVYLAMVGVGVMAAAAVERMPQRIAAAAAIVAVALLAVVAHLQTYAWEDGEALFAQAIRVKPTSEVGNVNLGNIRLEEARLGWRTGQLSHATTRAEEARGYYLKALAAHPDDVLARRGAAKAQGLIGAVSALEGRIEEAIPQLQRALEWDPDDVENQGNLERLLQRRGGGGVRR